MDFVKFFDTVNHDRLRQLLSNQICVTRIISLISKFLNAGAMDDGGYEDTYVGVPQGFYTPFMLYVYEDTYVGVPKGGPLSHLLANIYLDI